MDEVKIIEPVLVKNRQGITIKACCASCEHESIVEDFLKRGVENGNTERYCSKCNVRVKNCDCCSLWEMKMFWRTFKVKDTGRTKSKEHLDKWAETVLLYRDKIDKAKESGDWLLEKRLRDEYGEFQEKRATLWES